LTRITVEPLGRQHDRTAFHCGADALDRYLKQQARQEADKARSCAVRSRQSARHTRAGLLHPVGLGADLADLPDELARKLPRYPQLPVTLLGRLAVDQSAKGQGLGEHLLLDALNRSLTHAGQIAAMAVVVDAKDEYAARFYRHYGLLPLQPQPSRLFVPMTAVAKLLGK
jgi:GNAT superfamily N-acetyltransferase